MLWIPEDRKTRSGAIFSPFTPALATLLKSQSFDFVPLLQAAVCLESDEQDDVDDLPRLPDSADATPDDQWMDELDERNPPLPPPKRIRMSEVIASGARPQSYAHKKRRHKRNAKIMQDGQHPRPATLREYVQGQSSIPTKLEPANLPVAFGGYAAKHEDSWGSKKPRTLQDLLSNRFQLIRWDGFTPRPIVDIHGRIIAVLAGQPRSADYAAAAAHAFDLLEAERQAAQFHSAMGKHRRGGFVALNVGLLYGKGQRTPSWLQNGPYASLLDRLLGNDDINRLATFASAAFCLWAPRLYNYYKTHDDMLRRRLPHLRRIFAKSIFACATFNFGPNVWTYKHRDVLNLPFGWCAVQALGPFDPTKGGHLVLWDLKLVIEFPPGALILLPSATMTHSNVPVQPGDQRASFTQYSAGGIFRYVDNGFRTEAELAEDDPDEYIRVCERKPTRWEMGLGLLSTVDELLESI